MRVLAVDFGEVRIGLAVSDPEGRFAMPLTTIERKNDLDAVAHLLDIATSEAIGQIIVGEPLHLDGGDSDRVVRVRSFLRKLEAASDIPCELVDERLTTVEARERLVAAGVDLTRHPERIDAVAAQVLLEQFLNERSRRLDE